MKRTTPALGAVFTLFLVLVTAVGFGQEVSSEALRHFEAGLAAVEAAGSPADYRAAIAEFEQAARLAPGWPGAFRALGLVERAARRYGDAARSFRRYVELAPGAADASRFRSLIDEMDRQRDLEAGASRILEMMASGRYSRKLIGKTALAGELAWSGSLENFRLEAGGLRVENPWYPGDRYHPDLHPPIPDRWEPVKVDGRFYEYGYSHYMDTTAGYVVRFDYGVKGEVVSLEPPRLKETVDWFVAWGAPVNENLEPWTGDPAEQGAVEYLCELAPRAGEAAAELRDGNGRTKLHLAAIQGRRGEAGSLIAAGADINARDNAGASPLHAAAGFGQRSVAELLLTMGADFEARNDAGDTPLHAAAYWGRSDVVGLLVEFGADVNARNKKGLTPLRVAEDQKHDEVAALLRSRGAKQAAL